MVGTIGRLKLIGLASLFISPWLLFTTNDHTWLDVRFLSYLPVLILGLFHFRDAGLNRVPFLFSLVVLLLASIPAVYAPFPIEAWQKWAVYAFLAITFWVFAMMRQSAPTMFKLHSFWFASLLMLTFWGFGELLLVLKDGVITHQETYTVTGGFGHRNLFVQALVLLLPICWLTDDSTPRIWKIIVYTSTSLLLVLLLNRTAWLSLLLLLVVFLLPHSGSPYFTKRSKTILLGAMATITALLLTLVDEWYTLWHHAEMTINTTEGTTFDRLRLVQITWEMIKKSPVFGIAWGSWPVAALQYDQSGMLSESASFFYKRPHNDFLWTLSEGGMIAGWIFPVFFFGMMGKSVVNYLRSRTLHDAWLFASWLIFLITSITGYPMEHPFFLVVLMWLSVATLTSKTPPVRRARLIPKWSVIAIASLLCVLMGWFLIQHQQNILIWERIGMDDICVTGELPNARSYDANLHPLAYHKAMEYQESDPQRAMTLLDEAIDRVPNHPHLWNARAEVLLLQGQDQDATQALIEAVKNTPRYADAWLNWSTLHHQEMRLHDAVEAFLRADPQVVTEAYRTLGTSLAIDTLNRLVLNSEDRKMTLTLEAIRNTPHWAFDVLHKAASNELPFPLQAHIDACYYMWTHCDEYDDCHLARTMIEKYLPNGFDDLNLPE